MVIKQRLNILQSKLTIANTPHTLIRGPLVDRLSAIFKKKLALVIAAAGFGKTTLVAHTLSKLEGDAVWYRLDETDTDFSIFLSYLIKGIV